MVTRLGLSILASPPALCWPNVLSKDIYLDECSHRVSHLPKRSWSFYDWTYDLEKTVTARVVTYLFRLQLLAHREPG